MSRHLDTTPQSSKDLGFAKSLMDDLIYAMNQPEDVRPAMVNYAVQHIRHARAEGGRLNDAR